MTYALPHLAALSGRYDVLLCDIWGVIHNGREAFSGPCAVLTAWRRDVGPVVLISNSPRPAPEVVVQLDALGVPRSAYSVVVTSGDATRVLLAALAPGPAYRIGPDRDDPLYAGLGLDFGPLETARFIACTGPNDDEVETPEHYRPVLTTAAAMGLEMICANPDLVVQRGDRLIYCGGALAALYQTLGGAVSMAGKPHAPIYQMAISAAGELMGQGVDRRRVLAIGDGLATDIRGANAQGLDVLFIAGGIAGEQLIGPGGALNVAEAERMMAAEGLIANFLMPDLV